MYKSMSNKTGRAAIVLPQGALSRMGTEANIRKEFLENGVIEAVIALGPNLFYGTTLAPSILILRSGALKARNRKILFINGSKCIKRGRNQNTLEQPHIDEILNAYKKFVVIPEIASVIDYETVVSNNFDLSVPLYVNESPTNRNISLAKNISELAELRNLLDESQIALTDEFKAWRVK